MSSTLLVYERVGWRPAPVRALDSGLDDVGGQQPSANISVDRPIFDQVREISDNHPSALAVDDGETRLSYGELVRRAGALAGVVAQRAPRDAPVAIGVAAPAGLAVAMLACLKAGRPFVALDARDPAERRRQVLEGAGAALLVRDAGFGEAGGWAGPAVDVSEAGELEATNGDVDAPAAILFTSGSTGAPKGLANSQRALLQRVAQYAAACHAGPGDVFLPLGGLATIAGLREIFTALLSGAALHLVRPESAGVRNLRELVARVRPTIVYTVPSILRVALSERAREAFASLRVLRIGGEEIRWSDIELARRCLSPGCQVQIGYSCTESTGSQWFVPRDLAPDAGPVPIGYMLPGVEFDLVGPDGAPAGPGELGELVIRSPFVALGEWRDGRLVPGRADPLDPRLRIHATGDLARMEADGLMRFAGRNDRQLKVNGVRLEAGELEHQLLAAGRVEDAAAVVTDAGELVAFVAATPEPGLESRLRAHLRGVLPRGLQPARLHVLAEIPRLSSGKVDRRGLQALDATAAAEPLHAAEVAAATRVDEIVRLAWSTALPGSRRAEASWEDEGGDSLKLLNFVLELEELLGVQLELAQFLPHMTRADFARAAVGRLNGQAPGLIGGDRPTIFFFPGMYGDVPASARFRARLASEAVLALLRYPDLAAVAERPPTVEELGRQMADEIERRQPNEALRLAGYSFGAVVAAEAARLLVERDRKITFLGLLDSDISLARPAPGAWLRRVVQRRRELAVFAFRNLVQAGLKAALRLRAAAALPRMLDRTPMSRRLRRSLVNEFEGQLRLRSLRDWAGRDARPIHVPAALFRSDEPRPGTPEDLGWSPRVQSLEIVAFSGAHVSCLGEAPYMDDNAERFLLALRRAEA